MTTVAIVTDSAADLPAAWQLDHDVAVVPLTVRLGTDDLLDGPELDARTFWARCQAGGEVPSTASPSPAAFDQAFRSAAERGAAEVVCVTLASTLSSTFQSARLAAAGAGMPVHVVDSGSASLGQAFVVLAAAGAREAGSAAAVQAAHDATRRVRVYAVVDRLDHLRRSGRLGASRALAGSVLAVKPIVEVRAGEVVPVGRQRTIARAVSSLVELVAATRPEQVAVVHGDADAAVVDQLVADLAGHGLEASVHLLGPVVGAHLGPGTVAVAVLAGAGGT